MAEVIKTVIDVELNTGTASQQLRNLQQQINAFNLTLNKGQLTQGQAAKVWSEGLLAAVNRTGFFRAEVVKMQTAASALDTTLKKGQASLGQFFSAAFNRRSAMAAETFALAAERARTMQTQFVATGKAAKGMQDALAIRPLSAFVSEASIASQRMQILGSMFRQGTTQLINFGKNVQWAGRQLMVGFTVPLTIFGSTAGRVFKDLEKEVVAFKKVYGDLFTTPAELEENLNAVKQLAAEYTKYGVAVKDTVNLAAQAAAAGRQNADLTDAVTSATRLATLGQLDMNLALDATIALQSAFKISGQELADTINYLNMVENQTVVSLQDIAAAIPRVAPVIQGLGGDVKDLTVFMAAMQEGGVTAEQGANALKSGLASLINPTKAATETLAGFGINLKAIVDVNRGDLMGTVTTFAEALQKLDEFQRQQALEEVFGKFQYARLGALFENIVRDGSQASQVMETMGYTTEELRRTAEKELNTISQSFGVQLMSAIERFKLAIAPIGELFVKMSIPIVNFITKIVNWFNSLPEGVKNFTAIATVITGVVVPAATMMFGLFMNLVGTLAKMTQGAAIFGATLVKNGPIAALKSLTQSSKYLSLAEIDAANAAQQLGSATNIANEALLSQVGAAEGAMAAINNLRMSYTALIDEQLRASTMQGAYFGPGKAASDIAKTRPKARIKGIGFNNGGQVFTLNDGNIVPGTGNTDTVPAMLTPGEFVVNKEATKNNLGLLHAINGQQMNAGGKVKNGRLYAETGLLVPDENFITATTGDYAKTQAAVRKAKSLQANTSSRKSYPTYSTSIAIGEVGQRSISSLMSSQDAIDLMSYVERNHPNLIEAVLGDAKKRSHYVSKQRINLADLVKSVKKIVPGLSDYSDKQIKQLGGTTHRAHIGIRKQSNILTNPLLISKNKSLPKGTPVTFLDDLVFDFAKQINYDLINGKPANTILSQIQSMKDNGKVSLNILDQQFEQFLKQNGLSNDSVLKSNYVSARDRAWDRIISRISSMNSSPLDDKLLGQISSSILNEEFGITTNQNKNHLSRFINLIQKPGNSARFMNEAELHSVAAKMNIPDYAKLDREMLTYEIIKRQNPKFTPDDFAKLISDFGSEGTLGANTFRIRGNARSKFSYLGFKKLKDLIFRNKGGMIPGVQYLNTGAPVGKAGKAIFEKGGVEVPEVMRGAFGLTSRYEDEAVKLMQSGFSPYDAGATMKAFQTGYVKLDISDMVKKAKNIDEYIQQRIAFEKSQYSLTKEMVRDLYKTKRLPKAKQQKILDEWNKNRLNKGGMVPGVQYFSRGGIAGFIDQIKAKMALRKLVSGRASGSQMRGGDTRGWNMPGIYMTKDKFSASNYAALAEKSVGTYGPGSLYSFKPKGPISVLNMRGKITKEQRQGLVDAIRKTDADDAYKKVVIDALQKAKTLDEARIIARSIPFRTTDLDRVSQLSTSLRDDVNNIIGLNNPADDFILNFNSSRSLDRKNIRLLDKKLNEMKSSGQYAPSIGQVNLEDDINQAIIKNKNKFKSTENKIDSKKIPGAKKSTQRLLDSFGFDPSISGYSQAARDPRTLKLFIESILKPGQFNPGTREQLAEMLFGTYGIKNLKSTNLFNKLSGVKRERVPEGVLLNEGNIVPGLGNTDTVPAMLTPGEFVVNKEATKQNLDLLHSINNGSLTGYNKGGGVAKIDRSYYGPQTNKPVTPAAAERFRSIHGVYPQKYKPATFRGAGPLAAGIGMAASMPFFGEGAMEQFGTMGSVAASFVAFSAAQSLATKAFAGLTKNINAGAKGLGVVGKGGQAISKQFNGMMKYMRFFTMSNPYVLATVAATASIIGFTKLHDNMRNSVSRYNNALYGSADSLENMAKAMGRTTPAQRATQRQAELIAGQRATQEEIAMSSQFMNSPQGQSLIKDLQLVKKMGGDQAEALRNQLTQGIMTGVLTPSEARQVATDIGIALKNEQVGINAVAQITKLVGPDGELIKNNRIEILSQIQAPTNPQDIKEQIDKEMKRIDDAPFWNIFSKSYDFGLAMQQLVKVLVPNDVLESQMQINTLQNNVIENALKEKEVREALREEYAKGAITYKEFVGETEKLNLTGGGLGIQQQLNALNAGGLKYNAAAGGAGTALFGGPLKQIGARLSGAGRMEQNLNPIREAFNVFGFGDARTAQIEAAEDLANKVTKQFDTQLSDMGLSDAERQDLLQFISNDFGGNLQDQAVFFGDLLSGKMSTAALAFIEQMAKADPEFQKIIDKYGLGKVTGALSPLANNQDLLMQSQQGLASGSMDLAQVEQLGQNWQKLEALPAEVVKSLKIDVSSNTDVNKFGPMAEDLKSSWEMLANLNPAVDKQFVFNLIALDSNGNPRSVEDMEKDAIRINEAMNKLQTGTASEKRTAELDLVALYNGMDVNDPAVQKNLDQLKKDIKGFDDFDAGTKSKLIQIDSQIDSVGLELAALEVALNDPNIGYSSAISIANRIAELKGEQAKLISERDKTAAGARIAGANGEGTGEKSAFERIKEQFENTKKYQKAIAQLTKDGVSGENIALVSQGDLLEMTTSQRKKAIDMMKQQQDIQGALNVLLLSQEDQQIRLIQNGLKTKEYEINLINRQIEDVQRLNRTEEKRIEKLQRQNELDQRGIETRNRALDDLSKKEANVNSVYNARFEALDKIQQANDRLAQQQQDRIALAGALTSGDFGAAAAAAATMTSNYASGQLQDTRAALESQRERELASLTTEVNGQLLTRVQIETQIDEINERIYQRNQSIQAQQDIIQQREDDLQPQRERLFELEGQRLKLSRDLETAEYNKWKTEQDGINATIVKWNEYWRARRGQGGKVTKSDYTKASAANYFGGLIKKAFGGSINYRGSNERPPMLLANNGMEVPGTGLSDKVPALLTPGEFVVRKSVAQANMPLLQALNSDVFPTLGNLAPETSVPVTDNSVSTVNAPVYNYSINVNVAETNTSAQEIASVVMSKIKMNQGRSLRRNTI